MSMKQKHLRMLVMLVFVFATFQDGLSDNWHNCSTDTCKSFFMNSTCKTNSICLCGVSNNQSTCSIDPVVIANQTGLNASSDQLSCCLCESNNTFCCSACQTTTTPGAPTTTPATTATPTSNPSPVPQAIIIAIFILNHDIKTYSSRVQELSLSFRRAVGNLTNTDNSLITVQQPQFLYGVLPYCGFQVTSYVSDPNIIHSNPQHCNSMVINSTIEKDVSRSIVADSVKLITDSVKEQKFVLRLWDGSEIKATFVLSKLVNGSFMFHRAPDDPTASPTSKTVPPIHTNLWPLIYSAIGVFSLITLCIVWQCCKQSYLLRKKKYTDINSNRVNTKKRKIQEAMSNQENSEKEPQRERGMFDMTHNKLQQVDNDALTRRYDWTTPVYVPNMLAPAYSPTELHGQHSPPRLMLDDDDDSDNDKKSLGKASVINVDEETDEDLKDILESDDENGVFKERTNTRQSHASQKKTVPGATKRKPSTISKASKSSRQSAQNASTLSTSKMPNPAIGQVRKCSYSGPEGRERTPSLGFGIIKANRITPVNDDGKSSVSSGKPRKKENSKC